MLDVYDAVKGLTNAQRSAILDGYIGDQAIVTVRALKRKGLFHLVIDSPNGRCGFMRLTQFGEKVRSALRKAQNPRDEAAMAESE